MSADDVVKSTDDMLSDLIVQQDATIDRLTGELAAAEARADTLQNELAAAIELLNPAGAFAQGAEAMAKAMLAAQPITAVDPTNLYETGYFDGVMAYGLAIAHLPLPTEPVQQGGKR